MRSRLSRLGFAATAASLAFVGLAVAPAHAAGTVTGVVKSKIGATVAAVPDALVAFDPAGGGDSLFTNADANGRYTRDNLPDGEYSLRIFPQNYGSPGDLGFEYYDNAWSSSEATTVTVAGGTVTLNDVVLEQPGWVTGLVTDQDGTPLADTTVNLSVGGLGHHGNYRTDATGRYDTRNASSVYDKNVIPGSYEVSSYGNTSDYSHGARVFAEATAPVTIAPNAGAVVDLQLTELKTTIFTVLDTNGSPLTWAPVNFLVQRTPGGPFESPQYGPNMTNGDGEYRFIGDEPVKLQIQLPEGYTGTAVPEWWDGPSGDGAYRIEDAATLTWPSDAPMQRHFTIQMAPAPLVTGAMPTITGTAQVDSTLTANPGTWGPTGVTLAYQWKANGTNVGTNSPTYTPVAGDETKTITVTVTGTLTGHTPLTHTSTPTAPVTAAPVPPVTGTTPTITGTPQVDSTLTANPGTWGPTGVTLAYQWKANGTNVGTNSPTYTPVAGDETKTITVTVTGTLTGHTPLTHTSTPTAPVTAAPVPPVTGTMPTITGTARNGATLTARPGTWGPAGITLAYEWLANGSAIAGAAGTTLRVTNALAGKSIAFRVTGTLAGATTVVRTSALTAPVVGTFAAGNPSITGKAKVGTKLTARAGVWSPAPTLRYQWLRNGKAIKGATKSTYKLTKKDRSKKISVRVTGTRAAFATVTKVSKTTGKVKR